MISRDAGRIWIAPRAAAADLAVAAGALGLAAAVVVLFAFPYEDAFIHFRIARNLAEHGEPVFNLGERVMGDSSPLWMLLLGAGFSLLGTADYAWVGRLEAAIVVATALLAHRLLAGRGPGTAATAAAALFATAALVPSAGGGMETPMAMMLLTSGALAIARDRWRLAGVLLALGAACRLELLVAGLAALWAAPRRRRPRLAASFVTVAGVLVAWLVATYGTAFPNTVTAKSLVYRLTAREFLVQGMEPLGLPAHPLLGLVLLLALCGAGLALAVSPLAWPPLRASAVPGHPGLVVLGALPAGLALAYALKRPMLFPWYWPLLMFPVLLGLALVAVRWPRAGPRAPSPGPGRLAVGALAALAAVPVAAAAAGAIQTARDVREVAAGRLGRSEALLASARARTYLEIGAELDRGCRSGSVLAAEIGALGWTYRGRIIDGVGLVSPEVLVYHPLRVPEERPGGAIGVYPARAVAALRPDRIVAMEIFHTDFARKAPFDPVLRRYTVLDVRPVFSPTLAAPDPPPVLWFSRHVVVLGDPARCGHPAPEPAGQRRS